MQRLTEKILFFKPPTGLFNKTVINNLFPNLSNGAIKALVFKAMDKGEILQIKPGLYCLDSRFRENSPHPFVVAALLHSPSYISMESALQFHGLIPEAVYQVRSVTQYRSRIYKTPLGYFQFFRIPCKDFRAGVKSEKLDKSNWVYIATPLRAIADILYMRRKGLTGKEDIGFLTDSLRMEQEELGKVFADNFDDVYNSINNRLVKQALLSFRKGASK